MSLGVERGSKQDARILLVSHTDHADAGGGAERTRGLVEGFRQIGLEVDWYVLKPDTRWRFRRFRPWWFHRASQAELATILGKAEAGSAVVACYLPVAHAVLPMLRALAGDGAHRVIYAAENDESTLARLSMSRVMARRVKHVEDTVLQAVPEVWVPGSRDAKAVKERFPGARVLEVPSGVRPTAVSSVPELIAKRAFCFGSWDFGPNRAGLLRLLEGAQDVEGTLLIFGNVSRGARRAFRSAAQNRRLNVEWRGYAESIEEMLVEARGPAIVPVWTGAGTKLRVVELASRGIPILGPTHAFVGLPAWIPAAHFVSEDPEVLISTAFEMSGQDWERSRVVVDRLHTELSVEAVVRRAWFAGQNDH